MISLHSPTEGSAAGAKASAKPPADLLPLVLRARAGDLGAQSELVVRYTTRLKAFVRTVAPDPNAVEDIVQVAMIKMARRISLLRDPVTFEPWLLTLARNCALDAHRRARCRPVAVADVADLPDVPEAGKPWAVTEILAALETALSHLSHKDQLIVRMVVQGTGYRAAAERIGISVGAVKLRLNRVRPFLRAHIGNAIGLHSAAKLRLRVPPRARLAA